MTLNLFRFFTLPHLMREKGRNLLTLAGICLGVAVFVAIEIANQSTLASFRTSLDAVAGTATIQIDGGALGVPEETIVKVIQVPGVTHAAPVVEAYPLVSGREGEILLVQGIDPLREEGVRDYIMEGEEDWDFSQWEDLIQADAIALTTSFAARYGLRQGDTITLNYNQVTRQKTIRALIEEKGPALALGGNFALMDIASAQETFDKVGTLDRIDVVSAPNVPVDEVIGRIEAVIPPGLQVKRPRMRNSQIEKILSSFQINLRILSYIAILVGMFLIFNTLNVSVARRRQEMAIIRSLGGSRAQIYGTILQEATILGLVGSCLGVGLGFALARSAISLVSRTVTSLYILSAVKEVALTRGIAAMGILIGLLCTLASSIIPARRASAIRPHLALGMDAAVDERQGALPCCNLAILAGIFFLAAVALSRLGMAQSSPVPGYLAALLVICGFTSLTPGFTKVVVTVLTPCMGKAFSLPGRFASVNLLRALGRASVAIAALMASLAMLISIAVMVESFRETVHLWTVQTLRADLYLTTAIRFARGTEDRLRGEVRDIVQGMDGVAMTDPYRFVYINYKDSTIGLASNDFNGFLKRGNIWFKEGDSKKILTETLEADGVLISENLEIRYGLKAGDRIILNTPTGERSFLIHGIYYDYSNDLGVVLMDRELFKRVNREDYISTLGIFLEPGADREAVAAAIRKRLGASEYIVVMSGQELRDAAMVTFRQTFRIFFALEIIAMIVALLGITNSLLISIMNRRREIAVLRSIGALKGQVRRMIVLEAGLMGLIGNLLGILAGIAISLIMVFVITRQSFGWSIRYRFQVPILLFSIIPVLITSILAGYFPAHQASGLPLSEALRYE
ncbi:MAG: FtsX-like permease family protein [bacterium]